MADSAVGVAVDLASETHAPPLPHRRPRVREVSSRFMTPLIHSNSTPVPTPRSKTSQRRLLPKMDENHIPETNRSFDKSSAPIVPTAQMKLLHKTFKHHSKDSGESRDNQHSNVRLSPWLDMPIATGTDRIVSSRYKQVSNTPIYRSNSLNSSSGGYTSFTAANRLLQEVTSDAEQKLSRISTSRDDSDACSITSSIQGSSSCPNSPLCVLMTKSRSMHDARSSMPDVDKWFGERNGHNAENTNDCARSLNFSSSAKVGGYISLPSYPSCIRMGSDVKKGKNVSSHQEHVHSFKLLSNHYLQWRFANAKAEACIHAQKQEAERKLYSLGCKLSDMRDSVERKRNELTVLRRIKTLTTIVEAQMPFLDEWSTLEEDYSNSLSCTTNALLDSSSRLPLSGNVRADTGELKDVMSSALKVIEFIESNIQNFMSKAEEMDLSVTELARMVGGERSFIEECGYLLSKTYSSQMTECSLRSTLMQLYNSKHHQSQTTK